jgi:hypothetical protein
MVGSPQVHDKDRFALEFRTDGDLDAVQSHIRETFQFTSRERIPIKP